MQIHDILKTLTDQSSVQVRTILQGEGFEVGDMEGNVFPVSREGERYVVGWSFDDEMTQIMWEASLPEDLEGA